MMHITLDIEEDWVLKDEEQSERYRELEELIIHTINKWNRGYTFKCKPLYEGK